MSFAEPPTVRCSLIVLPAAGRRARSREDMSSQSSRPQDKSGTPSQAAPARPVIQLPSFREVQAAQAPVQAPNFFQSARTLAARPSEAVIAPGEVSARPGVPGVNLQVASTNSQLPAAPQSSATPSFGHGGPVHEERQRNVHHTVHQPPPTCYTDLTVAAHCPGPSQTNPNAILVSRRQEGNPVLRHIRNVRWQFDDIVPDYMIGANACALFLSLRFHLLKPEYIHQRIRELQRSFLLRVLLCHVDVDDVVEPLQQVTRAAMLNQLTLICAWSPQECARYLETFKVYETKPADLLQGRADEDYLSRLNAAVTTVRGVNRTDVLTLGATFHTAAGMFQASMEDMSACPGIGPTKIRRLYDAFHEPFRKALHQPQQEEAADSLGIDSATGKTTATAAADAAQLGPDIIIPDSDNDDDDDAGDLDFN